MNGIYLSIFIANNIFITYIIYKLINIFYYKKRTSRKIEIVSYIIYFIIMTLIYLLTNNLLTQMLLILFMILILSLNYEEGVERRLLATIHIYIIFILADIIVNIIAYYFKVLHIISNSENLVLRTTLVAIISYIIVLIMEVNNNEKSCLKKHNKYYEEQLHMMANSLKANRTIIHDLKNHIACLYILVEDDRKDKTLDYLSRMTNTLSAKEGISCTGNTIIDSIINLKLHESQTKDIDIYVDIDVPEEIDIPCFDITVILGNLLDNAINAVKKIDDDRYIDLKLRYDKGKLELSILNSFNGEVVKENGVIITSHEDKNKHGIGLESIRQVVEKYKGTMEISYDENDFSVNISM